jgi:hypothetical protein
LFKKPIFSTEHTQHPTSNIQWVQRYSRFCHRWNGAAARRVQRYCN